MGHARATGESLVVAARAWGAHHARVGDLVVPVHHARVLASASGRGRRPRAAAVPVRFSWDRTGLRLQELLFWSRGGAVGARWVGAPPPPFFACRKSDGKGPVSTTTCNRRDRGGKGLGSQAGSKAR